MSQIRVYGATNFNIDDLKANPNDLSVRLKVQLPHIHVNGDYDVQGRLLLLPLSGIGSFKGNFSECWAVTLKTSVVSVTKLDKLNEQKKKLLL